MAWRDETRACALHRSHAAPPPEHPAVRPSLRYTHRTKAALKPAGGKHIGPAWHVLPRTQTADTTFTGGNDAGWKMKAQHNNTAQHQHSHGAQVPEALGQLPGYMLALQVRDEAQPVRVVLQVACVKG